MSGSDMVFLRFSLSITDSVLKENYPQVTTLTTMITRVLPGVDMVFGMWHQAHNIPLKVVDRSNTCHATIRVERVACRFAIGIHIRQRHLPLIPEAFGCGIIAGHHAAFAMRHRSINQFAESFGKEACAVWIRLEINPTAFKTAFFVITQGDIAVFAACEIGIRQQAAFKQNLET